MYLSKKKILKAMRLAAGDDSEALEIVRFVDECGVHVTPHPGHPLLDEMGDDEDEPYILRALRHLKDPEKHPSPIGPLQCALHQDMLDEYGENASLVEGAMMSLKLAPRRTMFGGRAPWHFPIPELAEGQVPILVYKCHRDFVRRHPKCPWVSDMKKTRLWSPDRMLSCESLSVSPVDCTEGWRGLSLLYCAAGIKWSGEEFKTLLASPLQTTESARLAEEALLEHELYKILSRMARLIEGLILANSQMFLGTNRTPGRLVEPEWMEDPKLERELKRAGSSTNEVSAMLLVSMANRKQLPKSKAEDRMRQELLVEIGYQTCIENGSSKDQSLQPSMPIGSC